jgi:DNA-binding transcriptional LysR family regulator
MWEHVELREIRVFLALCEELHFGRTAQRLQISQTRVSQTIRALEGKLGVRLFERTSRRVALTAAGSRLRGELGPAHGRLAEALRRAYTANGAIGGVLRLGVFSTAGGPGLIEILRAFEGEHPECEIEVSEAPWEDALGPLQRGEVDLLAMRLPIERTDLVVGPILTSLPRVLAVARDHPLAGRASVTLEDVADYRVARLDALPAELEAELIPARAPSGRPIRRLRQPIRRQAELTALIALGRIVHPTGTTFAGRFGHPDIAYVPMPGLPPCRSALLWRRGTTDARIAAFARIAEAYVGALASECQSSTQAAVR